MIKTKKIYEVGDQVFDNWPAARRAEVAATQASVNEEFLTLVADFIGDDRFDGLAREIFLSRVYARFNVSRKKSTK